MPSRPLPCHPDANAKQLRDLGHLFQFDFDLYRCDACEKPWIWAFSSYGADWEEVTNEDAEKMQAIPEPEMRPFMRVWAQDFN